MLIQKMLIPLQIYQFCVTLDTFQTRKLWYFCTKINRYGNK